MMKSGVGCGSILTETDASTTTSGEGTAEDMLSRILIGILLGEAGLAIAVATALDGRPEPVAVLGLFVAIVFGLAGLLQVLGQAIGLACASPRPAGIGGPTPAAAIGEWLAFVALFGAIMPFARLWMGSDAVGRLALGRRPVLLVPGYMCNRGLWWWFRRRLRGRGFAVATVTLEPPFADIETLADALDRRIADLLAETGADRVLLVTHSMGGLVARAAMRRPGRADRVARLVTLGGPHHGTVTARLGLGRNARRMRPDDPWLAEMNRTPLAPVPTLAVWSTGDEIVVPQASGRLDGAREIVRPAIGHVAMVLSPAFVDLVAADLALDPGAVDLTDAGRA